MKEYFIKVGKTMFLTSMVIFSAIGTIAFALTFPTNTPVGGTAGGNLTAVIKNMLVDGTNLTATNSGTVKDSDKVDGLHAADLGGLSAAGGGNITFRLINRYDMGDTFSVGSQTCKKLGSHANGDGSTGNYYYNNESKTVQAIAGAGCYDWLYSWSYGTSNMIYCPGGVAYDYLCTN